MNRILTVVLLASLGVAAGAQTFTNVSFNTTVVGDSVAFSTSGNSYLATLTGFTIGPGQAEDLAWIYNFDSTPVPAFTAVTIEIGGAVINGTLDIVGNEKVFDMSGSPVQVSDGLVVGGYAGGGQFDPFVHVQTFTFSQPVTWGQAQKDILFIVNNTGVANIDYVKQTFTPVPEPATVAVLGLGALALLRRNRKH